MRNFVFLSPNFPDNYWRFCRALRQDGFNVLGIGDCPYDALSGELKGALTEYYKVDSLENYDQVYRAVAYFIHRYGRIEYLESNNEYWLERDARLRADFNILTGFLPEDMPRSALVAALGNPDVTPDAVGPLAAQSVLVSRHLVRDPLFRSLCPTALCRTGVLAMTGMESAFQIRTLCSALHPDCVVVVDALAGSDPGGLCRSVQVSDAGIAPGSGVGNDREAIDRQLLGVPVVSVGVPTVTDASSLVQGSGLDTLFVTPRYIDSSVRQLGRLLGYGINAALTPGLSVEDMELLLD